MKEELTRLSAAALARLIRAREVTAVEAADGYLRRAELLNPRLNALVEIAQDVLERAREADRLAAEGRDLGPLHGLPLTVKDTIAVEGLRATAGSRVFAGRVAGRDAPAVARLRAAGAVLLGKTNCAEVALDYTSENPLHGRAVNPHDEARTPGGSSGGCASAVAARMTAASLGSDLSGSVRIPAHFCGVAALKPTAGRVPGAGHTPPLTGLHSLGGSFGPIARTVEDLELLFGVLSNDAGEGREATLRGVRVAWFAGDEAMPVTEETESAVSDAARALSDAGADVFESRPPAVERGTELWLALFTHATRRFLQRTYAGREDEAGPTAHALLKRYASEDAPSLETILDAWDERDRLRSSLLEWMEATPLFVAPVGAVPAFRHEESRRVEVGGRTIQTFRAFGLAQAFNVFDLPAACVPVGRTRGGMPLGVQVVGRPFEERRVLAAARVIEEALGGWQPPPETLSNGRGNPL